MSSTSQNIYIVDYGMGNLFNVKTAFNSLGVSVRNCSDPKELMKADKIILPGVGAFSDGIDTLKKRGLDQAIIDFTKSGNPVLGICLGMQLLLTNSFENGKHSGLDIISGDVIKFEQTKLKKNKYKIPQIGWNKIIKYSNNHGWDKSILSGFSTEPYMYFLHSYFVVPQKKNIILSETLYAEKLFCSTFQDENIIGCQFHPERSGVDGLKILENFINL